MKAMCLCRKHHTEIHDKGEKDFLAKYHLEPVKIDKDVARKYRLNRRLEE